MLFGSCRPTVSKLKYLSEALKCRFSRLRYSLYSKNVSCKLPHFQHNFNSHSVWNLSYSTTISSESPFENVNVESITKGDDDLAKKLKVIILEVEVMRQEGMKVPSQMTDERWSELLNLPSRSQRLKLLTFWWLNEKKREKSKQKKEEARLKRAESIQQKDERKNTDHIFYGFGGCTIFLRVYDSTIDHFHNCGLIRSMMFGQNLVIDCSYDEYMNQTEASLCAKQLKILFADNRVHRDPFNIHFCNANKEGHVFTKLHNHIPTMYDKTFPMNITEKSYMDLFPKDRLVYLTPHCRNELQEFNHDDIYIVGAMVDKVSVDPLSLGKAKSLGLRMAKLPLERYLDWGIGGKSLTINQMLLILLELKSSQDWRKALQHVPRRKLKNTDLEERRFTKYRKDKVSLRF